MDLSFAGDFPSLLAAPRTPMLSLLLATALWPLSSWTLPAQQVLSASKPPSSTHAPNGLPVSIVFQDRDPFGIAPSDDGGVALLAVSTSTSWVEISEVSPTGVIVSRYSYNLPPPYETVHAGVGVLDFKKGSIARTADGGLISAVLVRSGPSARPVVWLMRTDAAGGIVWSQLVRPSDPDDYFAAVAVSATPGDSFILSMSGPGTGSGNPTYHLVARIGPAGNVVWCKQFTHPVSGVEMVATADLAGGAFFTFYVPGAGSGIGRLDPSGATLWTRSLSSFTILPQADRAVLAPLQDGGVAAVSIDNVTFSAVVVRLDRSGALLWGKSWPFPDVRLNCCAPSGPGGVEVGGEFYAGTGGYLHSRITPSGSTVFSGRSGSSPFGDDSQILQITPTHLGNAWIVGSLFPTGGGIRSLWLARSEAG